MKIKSLYVAIVIISVIFISIAVTSFTGLWVTTTEKVPAKFTDGEFSGQYNPADIKGSYTFDDIHNTFEIPLEDIGKAFGLKDPALYASFEVKELENIYASLSEEGKEVGTGTVRYFVALYKGLPYSVEEETYFLKPAVSILKEKAALSEEQLQYLETHSVDMVDVSVQTETTAEQAVSETADKTIKGSTTFEELLSWGVKAEDVENILNEKIADPGEIIKDYATRKGVEFIILKEPLQKLADEAK